MTKNESAGAPMLSSFHVYTVANNEKIVARDLGHSPDLSSGEVGLTIFWNQSNASAPYAEAIASASSDYLVFAHQDVLLPRGWFRRVERELAQLTEADPSWAVAGVFGCDPTGELFGHVWDSALGGIIGGPFEEPIRAASVDELVIIVRRDAGVSFDPALPNFHLYGTDIVLTAEARGRSAYVIDAPVIHNTKPILHLGSDYAQAYRYMVRKWRERLPYPTVIVELTSNRFSLMWHRARVLYRGKFLSSTLHQPLANPEVAAESISSSYLLKDA